MNTRMLCAALLALALGSGTAMAQQADNPNRDSEHPNPPEFNVEAEDGADQGDDLTTPPESEFDELENQENESEEEAREKSSQAEELDRSANDMGERAALGVMLSDGPYGVWISSVYANSPASQAGLRHGDRIDTVNGTQYRSARDLTSAIGSMQPGNELTFHVVRGGQLVELKAKLGTRGDVFPQMAMQNQSDRRHLAFRVPFDTYAAQSPGTGIQARMKSLEDEIAALRAKVRELETRLTSVQQRDERRDALLEPEPTAGAIELGEP